MTTHTGTSTRRGVAPTAALRAEWRKFRSLSSTRTVLAVTVVLSLGVSALIVLFGGGANAADVQRDGQYDVIFFGAGLGVWAFAFLSAQFVTTEFRTGLGERTFIATPRRARVLVAKLVVLAGVGFVVGVVLSVLNVGLTQGVLGLGGHPTLDLTDPGLLRAVLLYVGLSMAVQGTLAALVAVVLRHPFGAFVVTIMMTALPVELAEFFGEPYAGIVPRWVPGAAAESLSGVAEPGSPGYLPLGLAVLDIAVWIAVVGALAVHRLRHRDVR
jgi:ABC-2 type transport system permease protein